ncbi:hypothetical protein D9758_002240 [Tetrapyrgos nigripes]|uniref:Uncharacterized protein n=1 Tax=Tetrapyrgos nigripes TaxID=182062 RepID=A0A8H5GPF8_9AGAR|nr:hypothetical protein D9758_002240 [Tetrapyrgos nigripes]
MSNAFNCPAEANRVDSDISGPGVRASFYVQAFFLVLLVDRSWQDAPVALYTFIAMSFGLTLAAMINRETIVLLEALQVSNLVWLANFGTFVALASYSRQKAANKKLMESVAKKSIPQLKFDYGVKYAAMLQTLFSMILTIYMWATVDRFCSVDAVYVFFVIKAPALGSGRIVSLTFSSILTALYILLTMHELLSYNDRRRRKKEKVLQEEKDTDIENCAVSHPSPVFLVTQHDAATPVSAQTPTMAIPTSSSSYRGSGSSLIPPSPTPSSATGLSFPATPKSRRPRRRRWSSELDPMFVGILICQIVVFAYFIVSSEMLLKYNHADDGGSYGFGQILALVVILPSALSVIGALREHGLKKKKKGQSKKKGRHHKRRLRHAIGDVV